MRAVVIGDTQTNVSLFAGNAIWPVEARLVSPLLNACFQGGELNCDLVEVLTAIYNGKVADSQIATQDGFFIMEMKRNALGHIEVAAEGRSYASPETYARIVFRIDQSYLPSAIADARRIFAHGSQP